MVAVGEGTVFVNQLINSDPGERLVEINPAQARATNYETNAPPQLLPEPAVHA
jgi:hypothetical protein